MIMVAIPRIEVVNECWGEILPFINKAIEYSHDELTPEVVLSKINSNELMLAVVYEDEKLIACVTFEQVNFDSGKRVINIQLAGGENVDAWFEEIERIAVDLAKVQGCSHVYIIGRNGWGRKMKPLGYSPIHTIFSKEVQ